MPTRINDLFVYLLLIGALVLAFMGIQGCASSAPPRASDTDRIPMVSAVYVQAGDGRCSGVAIDNHHFLTAKHCTDVGPFEVEAFPGVKAPATLVTAYPDRDAALMHTDLDLKVFAQVAPRTAHIPAGDLLVGVGFGCTGSLFTTAGVYLGVRQDGRLLVTAHGCGGDSGGPLFDKHGRVVGVMSGIVEGLSVSAYADVRGL